MIDEKCNERKTSDWLKLFLLLLVSITQYIFWYSIYKFNWCSNVKAYVLAAILFMATYVIAVSIRNKIDKLYENNIVCQVSNVLLLLFLVILLLGAYYFETRDPAQFAKQAIRHNIPLLAYCIILALFTFIFISVVLHPHVKMNVNFRVGIVLLFSFVRAWFLYAPNPFKDTGAEIFHIDAYVTSIINTLNLAPFEQYSVSIYGHYGLLYMLPVKFLQLFGMNQWIAITITICIFAFFTFLLQYVLLSKFIKSDGLFLLSVMASTVIISTPIGSGGVGYQLNPHRLIFPTLILFIAIKAFEGSDKKYKFIGYVSIVLALIWNIETGLVCLLTWMIVDILIVNARSGEWSTLIIKVVLISVGEFFVAYAIVNIYNLSVGGNIITFMTFLYPIGNSSLSVASMNVQLINPTSGYFIVMLVMFGAIIYTSENALTSRLTERQFATLVAAILGYGVFAYYINECYNSNTDVIVAFFFVFILAIAHSHFGGRIKIKKWQDILSTNIIISLTAAIIMCAMALSSVTYLGVGIKNRISGGWENKTLKVFLDDVETKVPKDTVAFGRYTSQLYSLMNRPTGIYISDWEDLYEPHLENPILNPEALRQLEKKIKEGNYENVLVFESEAKFLPPEYSLVYTFEYRLTGNLKLRWSKIDNSFEFRLYSRNANRLLTAK